MKNYQKNKKVQLWSLKGDYLGYHLTSQIAAAAFGTTYGAIRKRIGQNSVIDGVIVSWISDEDAIRKVIESSKFIQLFELEEKPAGKFATLFEVANKLNVTIFRLRTAIRSEGCIVLGKYTIRVDLEDSKFPYKLFELEKVHVCNFETCVAASNHTEIDVTTIRSACRNGHIVMRRYLFKQIGRDYVEKRRSPPKSNHEIESTTKNF